jgi:hypothetical protein
MTWVERRKKGAENAVFPNCFLKLLAEFRPVAKPSLKMLHFGAFGARDAF